MKRNTFTGIALQTKKWIRLALVTLVITLAYSCKDDFLEEKVLDSLSTDGVLISKAGFDNYLTALHFAARDEMVLEDSHHYYYTMQVGTDVGTSGLPEYLPFRNYQTYLTPTASVVGRYWQWAYQMMLNRANTIIVYANKSNAGIWANEAQKNGVIAEAKFFRAYTYNFLANLYGGVPIVDTVYSSPKTDFVRNTRKEVYEFARKDLEFAAQWLPETVLASQEGRIVRAAADHLLTEVYINLGEYDKAIASASKVIDSDKYKLMTQRFGKALSTPGDYYSDLFRDGNQNRSSGNLESIYVWQFEDPTPGGAGTAGSNNELRWWAPFYINLKDPNGVNGMVLADSLGRSVGGVRPNNYFVYDIWKDNWNNDIRNSTHNIRRTWYYNNPASAYFGKPIEKKITDIDTMQNLYPTVRKIEGSRGTIALTAGRTVKDFMVYRLAETYLLRAEAYIRKGDKNKAAEDINRVRERAKAKPVLPASVDIDYLLDERARELVAEEPRRRTLTRMGKLVERVRKYNMRQDTKSTVQNYHELWPIPQSAIDANFSAKLEQNPGY